MYYNFEWFTHNNSLFNPWQVMSPFLPSHVSGSWELLVFYGGLLHTPCLWWRKVGIWVIWRLRPWFYHDFIGETLWEVLKGVFWRNSPTKFIDGQVFCASCKTSNNPQENSCKIHPPRPYFLDQTTPGTLFALDTLPNPKRPPRILPRCWFFSSETPKKNPSQAKKRTPTKLKKTKRKVVTTSSS